MSEKVTHEERNIRIKALEQSDCNFKQTEENLKLFKKVVESATDAIGISTPEGRHWYQNSAFDALFGDIGEDPPATLYCDKNVGSEVFETLMAGGEWSGEVQMHAADGRVLDILLRAYAFTDQTGRVLGLVGVHTDITASNRSQELFKLVAQSTNDVFYEWNVQTDSLQWFSDISAELGYAPGEVPPTINGWIELIHPDDRPQLADAVMHHRTATHDINYLYRVKHKNGTWLYWRDHATPVLDSHNRPVRWVGGISDITEHKQVENAYKESEARFLQIAENIREVFWLFDLQEQRVLYVSPAYEQIWGRSRESLYERYDDWVECIHTEDVKHAQETFNHILDTGGGEPREYRIVRPDGTERWISDTGYAVKDADGKIVRITGIAEDITERKKAKEAFAIKASLENIIARASRRFLTLTELDKSINACLADIGRFCAAGRAYLFQFTSEDATMNNTHEWCGPGVKPEIENLQGLPLKMFPWWMKLLKEGRNIHVKNVSDLPPEARAEKEILEAQNIKSVLVVPFLVENKLAGFLGFDNVAASRAWGEKELVPLRTLAEIVGTAVTRQHADQALVESEERLRLQIERMPIALILWDHDFKVMTWNPAAESIFGYSVEEALGRHPYGLIVSQETQLIVDEVWGRLLEGDTTAHSLNENNTKDGRSIICSWTNTPLKNHEGSIIGVLSMVQDITEQKRAEEDRKSLQAQLIQAQKMEAIGTLAGGIAHNFNNILMGVQGRTSLMMMGKNPSEPDYEHLKGIEEYIKNAVELTRDLLGYARGGKYEVKPTDLNMLIKNENRMFGRTKREIRVHEKYEKDLWAVEVDQSQIKQALLNLYVNAWQAMPGEGDLYIQTENATFDTEYIKPFDVAPGRYVKVSVTDTGAGMDTATRERIFDPFFSTKDVGQGSGLGLASVYGIIKNHGGFINVYSKRGEGTTFNIYLPSSERKAGEEDPRPKRHEIHYGQGTVLFVDDEDMIVEVGQAMLNNLGYRAIVARSGQEALNLFEKQRDEIDLVILDMIMPGMGGGETYDRLREINGDVKVILSSGYSIEGQAKEIMDRGCSGFIQKPFAMEELSRKVREALDEAKE